MSTDKILVISLNGFSETNANGKTLRALLAAYSREELSQFYRGSEKIDFSFARNYFRVTDKEMLKSLLGKRPIGAYEGKSEGTQKQLRADEGKVTLSGRLRKHNYNFALRWIREILWCVAPWGRRKLDKWIAAQAPRAVVYMVGESIFEDRLVRHIARKNKLPVILYNCEGYRLIDLKQRRGIERLFYKIVQKSYAELQKTASLVIYNCDYLRTRYQNKYASPENATIAYNAAAFDTAQYKEEQKDVLSIAYFGNLGVGRVTSLLHVADVVQRLRPGQKIDVYGRPSDEDAERLKGHPVIHLHGFVNQDKLLQVREEADILLHVESFDPAIVPKLKNAFSTKIAQCLCSGRCLLTYAPEDMASTEYLLNAKCACVARTVEELEEKMKKLLESGEMRKSYADRGLLIAKENHDLQQTSQKIRTMIGGCYEY